MSDTKTPQIKNNTRRTAFRLVGIRDGSAFWPGNGTYSENRTYVAGNEDGDIREYPMLAGGGGTFNLTAEATAPAPILDAQFSGFPYPGASPVVSWDSAYGTAANGVLWIYATLQSLTHKGLFAYKALPSGTSLGSIIFQDTTNGPFPTKFSEPTVAFGHVYAAGEKSPPTTYCTAAGSCTGKVVVWQ